MSGFYSVLLKTPSTEGVMKEGQKNKAKGKFCLVTLNTYVHTVEKTDFVVRCVHSTAYL